MLSRNNQCREPGKKKKELQRVMPTYKIPKIESSLVELPWAVESSKNNNALNESIEEKKKSYVIWIKWYSEIKNFSYIQLSGLWQPPLRRFSAYVKKYFGFRRTEHFLLYLGIFWENRGISDIICSRLKYLALPRSRWMRPSLCWESPGKAAFLKSQQ